MNSRYHTISSSMRGPHHTAPSPSLQRSALFANQLFPADWPHSSPNNKLIKVFHFKTIETNQHTHTIIVNTVSQSRSFFSNVHQQQHNHTLAMIFKWKRGKQKEIREKAFQRWWSHIGLTASHCYRVTRTDHYPLMSPPASSSPPSSSPSPSPPSSSMSPPSLSLL